MVRDGRNFNFTRSWILLLGYWGICSQLPILGLDWNTISDMFVHSFVLPRKEIKGIQDMFLIVFCTILTIPSIWIYLKVRFLCFVCFSLFSERLRNFLLCRGLSSLDFSLDHSIFIILFVQNINWFGRSLSIMKINSGVTEMFMPMKSLRLLLLTVVQVAHGGGRAVRPVTCLVFAVMNGVFETRSFASSFDFGRLLVRRIGYSTFGLENWYVGPASFVVGSLTMMIYSGLIHALFWEKFILPPHLSHPSNSRIDPQESEYAIIPGFFYPRVRPTKANMIKSLTATSLAWMLFYHVTNELWLVVQLHCLIDGGVGIATRIQPPLELF